MSGLRPQFLGRALGALRSIGRTNRREDKTEIPETFGFDERGGTRREVR